MGIAKSPSGLPGLDEVMHGGFPAGRTTLVYGGPGCGKTVLAMEFVVHGAQRYGEPGLFVSCGERPSDLAANFASLGFDLRQMEADGKLGMTHVDVGSGAIFEAGTYSLDALFVRLGRAIDEIGARRVAIDTLETLFSSISGADVLRRELVRLFEWLGERGVTSLVTAQHGDATLTRFGLEEYLSDCVVCLDHRVSEQISKRRLRVVKYRGSSHGMDEYPFLIDERGFSVAPISSVALTYDVTTERVSTGIRDLDALFGNLGYFRGSSVLVSGAAGTGKTTIAAAFAEATCRRGERCLYLAFEEPAAQLIRNVSSVGIDLSTWEQRGLLEVRAFRPTMFGLEEHFASILHGLNRFEPVTVIMDPITNFLAVGDRSAVKSMLIRIIHACKTRGITTVFTALIPTSPHGATPDLAVSSMMDTWIVVDQRFVAGEHRRDLHVVKSRGMAHSHEIRRLLISSTGVTLHAREPKATRDPAE